MASQNILRDAVFRSDLAEVKSLVQSDCSLNDLDEDGRSALIHATIDCKKEIAEFLIDSGANVNIADQYSSVALHYAAQENCIAIVKILINAGAFIDAKDNNGNTPLSNAVFSSQGDKKMISVFLKAGADVNLKNEHGVSPKELSESMGFSLG